MWSKVIQTVLCFLSLQVLMLEKTDEILSVKHPRVAQVILRGEI
jgi:hypothetical protein